MNPPVTPPDPPIDTRARNRNRIALLALVAVFVLPILVAMWMARSDRIPGATGVHGEMFDPARDLRSVRLDRVEGGAYEWRPVDRTWRVLVVPPADCDSECAGTLESLDRVWRLLGRNADQLDVLWACAQPGCMPPEGASRPGTFVRVQSTPELRALLPGVDDPTGTPVYLLDPNGFLVLRWAPGFDPAGLRADVVKLIRLV